MRIEGTFDAAIYHGEKYRIYSNVCDEDFTLQLIDNNGEVFTVHLWEVNLIKIKGRENE